MLRPMLSVLTGLLAVLASAQAADPPAPVVVEMPVAPPVQAAAPAAGALPPMNFHASVAGNELFAKVKASATFARAEKELVGSPIQLRVSHSLIPTAGGQAAGLLSAIWAGSTLGLLPVVTNNNLVLTYEVRVNGKEVSRYEYQRSFTRAVNIWANQNDATYGLGEDGLAWVLSTADEFVARAAQDPALHALGAEYAFYFGKDSH